MWTTPKRAGHGRAPRLGALCLCAAAAVAETSATAAQPPAGGGDRASATATALQVVRQGLPRDALYDLAFAGEAGWAVGDHGTVLQTDDAGRSWRALATTGHTALFGVAINDERVIAVGQGGDAYLARRGAAFERVATNTRERLFDVAFADAGLVVAVGGFGALVRSTDGGEMFTPVAVDWATITEEGLEPHLYAVAQAADGALLACGEFGLVLRSEDAGLHWQPVHRAEASLFAMHLRQDGRGYAVGQEGYIVQSTDYGRTWTAADAGTEANLLDVWSSSSGEVVAVGIRALLRSSDDGLTWRVEQNRHIDRSWYQALASVVDTATRGSQNLHEEMVYAVGQTGRIVRLN